MNKYKYFIITVTAISLGILIWHPSALFVNDESIVLAGGEDAEWGIKVGYLTQPPDNSGNSVGIHSAARNRTIRESMARIGRNVLVTGTITGVPGQESAIFQIDGKPGREFKMRTQLMDGFIINKITKLYVVLRHQHVNETITLELQKAKASLVEVRPGEMNSASVNPGLNDIRQLKPGESAFISSSIESSDDSESNTFSMVFNQDHTAGTNLNEPQPTLSLEPDDSESNASTMVFNQNPTAGTGR